MNMYKKSFLIIGVITCIGVAGFLVWNQLQAKPKVDSKQTANSIEELLEQTVDTEMITTNLEDGSFIKVKLKIITNTAKNAEEIKKIPFLVESSIIKYFNGLTKKEAIGSNGFTLMEKKLKDELNKGLGEDYITQVYIVDILIQ